MNHILSLLTPLKCKFQGTQQLTAERCNTDPRNIMNLAFHKCITDRTYYFYYEHPQEAIIHKTKAQKDIRDQRMKLPPLSNEMPSLISLVLYTWARTNFDPNNQKTENWQTFNKKFQDCFSFMTSKTSPPRPMVKSKNSLSLCVSWKGWGAGRSLSKLYQTPSIFLNAIQCLLFQIPANLLTETLITIPIKTSWGASRSMEDPPFRRSCQITLFPFSFKASNKTFIS